MRGSASARHPAPEDRIEIALPSGHRVRQQAGARSAALDRPRRLMEPRIQPGGARSWVFHYRHDGKLRSLDYLKEIAHYGKLILSTVDPIEST